MLDDLGCHASPPLGEWANDPNALFFEAGRYHLYMQHARGADAGPVDWGWASSTDLLVWRWEGIAVEADPRGWAYSGSMVSPHEMFLTRHDPETNLEWQQRLVRRSGCWRATADQIIPPARNRRDPFVFRSDEGDWCMLLARPCDWHSWRADLPSRLELWRSHDRRDWSAAGEIGPWAPPGVLWEMPAYVRLDHGSALVLSTVDRREGGAEVSVRYWPGRLTGEGFAVDSDGSPDGHLLDLGFDFYAAIPSLAAGWPLSEPYVIAWAASWAYARRFVWPGGRRGGPMSLPRKVKLIDGRLHQSPPPAASPVWTGEGRPDLTLVLTRAGAQLTVSFDHCGAVTIRRSGALAATRHHPPNTIRPGEFLLSLFIDGPLCELFIEPTGATVTAILPGTGAPRIELARRA